MIGKKEIIQSLPYSSPFLFVDELEYIDENRVEGSYRFRKDENFYRGHFVGNPVTPGVILTETMAQIGLVCLGIYLLNQGNSGESIKPEQVAFSEANVVFKKMVRPGERVTVYAEKVYWRMGKLKCKTEMKNQANEVVCYGELSGLIK